MFLGVVAAGSIAYLVRDLTPAFLISAAMAWLLAMVQTFLGNIGCRYSPLLMLYNPIESAVYAAPLANVVGLVALLFAYALRLHSRRSV